MSHVTSTEVIDRLRTLTSTEITAARLASAAYIPAGDAWIDKILTNNGKSYDNLDSTDQALAEAAEIAWICSRVIASAPLRGSETGPIKIRPISAQDKKVTLDMLKDEWKEYIKLLGCKLNRIYFGSRTSDDYKPDGEDKTNLLWTDKEETTHSQWE